jgi:ACS family hexuronate transporter-like MFS transporter
MQMQTGRPSRIRWLILMLLFFATVVNYVDRQNLSILSPLLRAEFHLTEMDYSYVVSAFLLSYTVMYAVSGRIIDRVGVRLGMAASIVWWSLATIGTAVASGGLSLAAFRFGLGLGEPGVYSAGMRATAEWFSNRERALAVAIFSSGSALGAVAAPPLIAFLVLRFGWRSAFLLPGIIGLIWVPFWLLTYRSPQTHERCSSHDARQLLDGAGDVPCRSWLKLIRDRKVLAVVLPRIASDPVWYFYLFWLPDYLQRNRHFSLAKVGLYAWIPFLFADMGSLLGGACSDFLVRHGWPPVRSRIVILVVVACLGPLGAFVGVVDNVTYAIAITCLVAFLCQSWTTNIGALMLDLVPLQEASSVTGLSGTAGSLGGVLFAQVLGVVVARFGYSTAFIMAAALQPIAIVILLALLRPDSQSTSAGRRDTQQQHGVLETIEKVRDTDDTWTRARRLLSLRGC